MKKILAQYPLRRLGRPDDVIPMVLLRASPLSSWTTGQVIPVNGGYETDEVSENQAVIRYRFTDEPEKNLLLGKPSDWKLIYRTPGRIHELPVPFEFKELPLP